MSVELVLGIIGTVTGLASLLFTAWQTVKEKPKVKISDVLLQLEKKEDDKVVGELSFNVDNLGDRSTTLVRVNAILGDHVEVLEGLRDVSSHSSIRYPEKPDSKIKLFTRYGKTETLKVVVVHSHGSCEKTYKLPQISEWDEHALWKGGPLLLLP